jgi:hypothetical protein
VSQQINLYQPIFRNTRKVFSARAGLAIHALLGLALTAIYGFGTWQVTALDARVIKLAAMRDDGVARLDQLRAQFPPRTESPLLKRELAQRNADLARVRELGRMLEGEAFGNTTGLSLYLAGLARQHVDGTWLTRIDIAHGGNAIAVAGQALRPELVPAYLRRLSAEPVFAGKSFSQLRVAQPATPATGARLPQPTAVAGDGPAGLEFQIQTEGATGIDAGLDAAASARTAAR